MNTAFDQVANAYDEAFTFSRIGWLQRQQVWQYLEKVLKEGTRLNILELNCGTGEDAVYFAAKGHRVTATDIAQRMLTIARQKSDKLGYSQQITFQSVDIKYISTKSFTQTFDLVFSDFGGFNCVGPQTLKLFSKIVPHLLNPGGRFIAVIMPRFCAWENGYFLMKGQWRRIFRRNTQHPVKVPVGEQTVVTWYYSPTTIRRLFQPHFHCIGLKPIGICLPPSYMEAFFKRRPKALSLLNGLEQRVNRLSITAGMADHFLVDFKLKPQR